MNSQDRVMLERIDERTQNMWRVLDDQEESINKKIDLIIEGQKTQNGSIMRNTIYRRIITGVGSTAVLAFILHLIGIY